MPLKAKDHSPDSTCLSLYSLMEQFIRFVIRPPRADYSLQDLSGPEFSLKGHRYRRKDLEIVNSRGQTLQCSLYTPHPFPEDTALPCVVYCHGNSGCQADGNEAAMILLPLNITVLTLDFSGSGHSDGDYVSLGWNEKDDLKAVVTHLRTMNQISYIGLWGRSMGAVTSLLYGASDPSIAGIVLDSPFSNLFDLMMELVDVYKIRLPKFTVKVALQIMRRIIQRRAQFDIMDLNAVQVASGTFVPALFGHATEDLFIRPHHSDRIFESYAGDKNMIKFEGDHNSPRPQFFYDSLSIFFHNVLSPPPPPADACYDLFYMPDISQVQESLNKVLPFFVVSESQNANGESELNQTAETSGCLPSSILENEVEKKLHDDHLYPSSNCISSESWGRCSSNGLSENFAEELSFQLKFSECPRTSNCEIDADNEKAKESIVKVLPCTQTKERIRKGKMETLSHMLSGFRCLRGMGRRHKVTP